MFSNAFQSFLVLALAVSTDASPVRRSTAGKLSLSRYLNVTGSRNLVQIDQARARLLGASTSTTSQAALSEPVTNQGVVYSASVGVGSGSSITYYNLIIDTGSSNTFVGAVKPYISTTGQKTKNTVSVTYGSGSFSGTEWIDRVTLTSNLVISKQSIGVASKSSGFAPFDGILGIGPVDLTKGTLSPDSSALIPTVTDNLFSQHTIPVDSVAVSFEPASSNPTNNGELTWGGVDSSKFTGAINYAPITSSSPANKYWGVDQSISYGAISIMSRKAGIVDTGTTLVMVASNTFALYKTLTGAKLDSQTGLLSITSTQYKNLQTLNFNINGHTYGLTPNAQIWPRSLNTAIGGSVDKIYLIVADLGTGSGLSFIDGYTFLERFYTVFDTTNVRIGFATTPFTTATSN
ncbi:hypothetical protein M378DRAFT_10037 [Amanita muscaria Koide BX008]|uniref:Peptidase A1 domain-containing protein n=1 Tax=Amanita muscaria (strain Koide BX008) TaxID=946122 RepID=A0A0C2XBF5_AMAMK|nr:hypothetical protein M378DRAFT_10037 [Amanita muscaria Koide BX008]